MHNALADLQSFLHTVETMRGRQRAYFTTRNETNLKLAKSAERDVDQALQLLQKKGYRGAAPVVPKQREIF